MKKVSLKSMITYSMMICGFTSAHAQGKWQASVISPDKRFDAAIEISSIAYWQDTIYLASPTCDVVHTGKINEKDSLEIFTTKALGDCDYEGASYSQGYFYFSDDQKNSIFRYGPAFGPRPTVYPLLLNGNEGARNNKGFEGIAAINDTTFYLLLEEGSAGVSVLYKGILENGKIRIADKKRMADRMRYCDLFYDKASTTLYLLKTDWGKYMIDSVALDKHYNISKPGNPPGTLSSDLVYDFSDQVNKHSSTYGTNMEGMVMIDKTTFYVISDNCNDRTRCSCGKAGQNKKTLLLRLQRTK